ncbi:MAG: hypothetical protein SFV19_06720, partial [Rhodospirillaceae bacterium]|nr:hypothetical protein [Rhodospirillaceae bacterium]
IAVLIVAGLGLSGCIAFQAASAVAGVAVGTVSAVGRATMAVANAVTNTTSTVNRTITQIPAAMMYGPSRTRRVVIPNRAPPRQARAPRQRASAPARPAPVRTTKAKPAKPTSKERQQILEVLPPEVLDQMTKDELILQTMVQTEALAIATDEVIFWELDGHAGTATAETEHRMGTFTCRLLIETVKLDPAEDATATQSTATVCRTEATGWTLSF